MTTVLLAGLPRAGSTILCSLLAQNPAFKVSEASTLLPLMTDIRKFWSTAQRHGAIPKQDRLLPVLRAAWDAYHDAPNKVVIDKHREWSLNLDLVEKICGAPAKVICVVRNPLECAASFERLKQKEPETYTQLESTTSSTGATTMDRAKSMLGPDGSIGLAYSGLYEAAVVQERLHQMLFVDYHKLCANPQKQLKRIYNFLGMDDSFDHQFSSLTNAEVQVDAFYFGYRTLHDIESSVRPAKADLGRLNMFTGQLQVREFWQQWT